MDIEITSSAFAESGMIPPKYTCDGQDVSPPLQWESVPEGTGSIALICDDPDAPGGTWDHWILYNIPPEITALPAGQAADSVLFGKVRRGLTGWRSTAYGGPCPPGGTHRYFFKLYALDTELELDAGADAAEGEGYFAFGDYLGASRLAGTRRGLAGALASRSPSPRKKATTAGRSAAP